MKMNWLQSGWITLKESPYLVPLILSIVAVACSTVALVRIYQGTP